jgi:hypothetical protein
MHLYLRGSVITPERWINLRNREERRAAGKPGQSGKLFIGEDQSVTTNYYEYCDP